jgi:hypothetical protein
LTCALSFEKESERETEGEGDREEEGKRGKHYTRERQNEIRE